MKLLLPLFVFVILTFSIVLPQNAYASVLFTDSFTDADSTALPTHDSDWTIEWGNLEIQSNQLYAPVSGQALLGNHDFRDGCVSYDVQFPLTNIIYSEMRANGTDFANNIYSYLAPGESGFTNGFVGYQTYYGSLGFASGSFPTPSSGMHNYKLCAIGDRLSVAIDNAVILEHMDLVSELVRIPGSSRIVLTAGNYADNYTVEEIHQLSPVATVSAGAILNPGDTYTAIGSYTDTDSARWTTTVDYGDGSAIETLETMGITHAFALSHMYTTSGTYTVTFAVTDDLGDTGTATATVVVNSLEPQIVAFGAVADTYVKSGSDNRNTGAGTFMRLQSSGDNRSLVKFDQTAMQTTIGNKEILSAKLRVIIVDNSNKWGTTGRTIDVHRLIANWAEGNGTESDRGTGSGATWNCAIDSLIQNQAKNCSGTTEWEMGQPNNPAVHPWVQTASATQNITNNQSGVVEFDVTDDVASFLNSTNPNYGWIIKKTAEGKNGQVSFGTKESASVPQLVVTYQP